MSEPVRTVLVSITGRVQGVWFRGWTKGEAEKLEISGWVRNRLDQSVEALFCGSPDNIDEMIENCHRGPRLSHVDGVTVMEEGDQDLQGFEIRETL